MQSGAKIMGRLHHHHPAGRRRRVLPSRVVWNAGSKSGATHFSGNGGFLKQQLPVGDSIIDLGESRHKKRREEETPLNFLVLFFKSDKWLAKMSVLPFCQWSNEAGKNRITEYRSFSIIYRTEPNHTLFKSSSLQI